jgi:hypothetical protein
MKDQLIVEIVKLANNVAVALVGIPTELIACDLRQFAEGVGEQFQASHGVMAANQIADWFFKVVLRCKSEIENKQPGTAH